MAQRKPSARIRMLPRTDSSEMPTDSDQTIPDTLAYEAPKRLQRKPVEERSTSVLLTIIPIAVCLFVILAALYFAR